MSGYLTGYDLPLKGLVLAHRDGDSSMKYTITRRAIRLMDARLSAPVRCFRGLRSIDSTLKVEFILPYVPNLKSPMGCISGFEHRVGRTMPKLGIESQDFIVYAKTLIRVKFPFVDPEAVKGLVETLDATAYPGKRKRYFIKQRLALTHFSQTHVKSMQGFLKDEEHETYKEPRCILHPEDDIQADLLPLQHAVDDALFTDIYLSKWFVKHSDPTTWPQRLKDLFGDDPVVETDFKSMEAHHREIYSEILVYWIMHMLRRVPFTNRFRRELVAIVRGYKICNFDSLGVRVQLKERLMSGSLWTSSANSVLNFLLNSYMTLRTMYPDLESSELVSHLDEFRGIFEGDDGLFVDKGIDLSKFGGLGLDLTFEKKERFNLAHFCQIVCDDQTLEIVPNPMRILRKFFALPKTYISSKDVRCRTYLRAKAESYKYLYPNAPVIGPMCDWILSVTSGLDTRTTEIDVWRDFRDKAREKILVGDKMVRRMFIPAKVQEGARIVMEKVHKLSHERQLELESAFNKARLSNSYVVDWDQTGAATPLDYEHFHLHFTDSKDGTVRPQEVLRKGYSPKLIKIKPGVCEFIPAEDSVLWLPE